eukprot:TRINITY_DN18640_c0_g1_i1.p1 TRINITY_DN18640_c0_g1~~TRINITY_DN18640_c0_g1_i1.p1  ORF type:complete len:133 (+),score=20.05 TRINITY_DN18640_c0_g1_i1:108-506(+)
MGGAPSSPPDGTTGCADPRGIGSPFLELCQSAPIDSEQKMLMARQQDLSSMRVSKWSHIGEHAETSLSCSEQCAVDDDKIATEDKMSRYAVAYTADGSMIVAAKKGGLQTLDSVDQVFFDDNSGAFAHSHAR